MKPEGEPLEIFLWHKVTAICRAHHPHTVPCVTLSDFVTDFPYPPQTFVDLACPALEYYNEIFGKQDFGVVESPSASPEGKDVDVRSIMLKPPKLPGENSGGRLDLDLFMSNMFISLCASSIGDFLLKEFPQEKDMFDVTKARHRECLDAINVYNKKAVSHCLEFPNSLQLLQSNIVLLTEIDDDEDTSDRRKKINEILAVSKKILRLHLNVMEGLEFGLIIRNTLNRWKETDPTLKKPADAFEWKYKQFCNIYPFTIISELADFHDMLLNGLSEALDNINSADFLNYAGESSDILYLSEFT